MLVAMGLAAAACILIGLAGFFPHSLYRHLPYLVDYVPYTLSHVTSSMGMLAFTALGFFLLLKHIATETKISLDTDWFYRRGSLAFVALTARPLARLEFRYVGEIYAFVMRRLVLGGASVLRGFATHIVDFTAVGVGRVTQASSRSLKNSEKTRN